MLRITVFAVSESAEMLLLTVFAAFKTAEMQLFTVFAASENIEMLLCTVLAASARPILPSQAEPHLKKHGHEPHPLKKEGSSSFFARLRAALGLRTF